MICSDDMCEIERERACVCGIVGIVTVGVKDKNGLLRPAEALEIGVGGYLTSGGSRRTLRGYCIFYILLSRKYAFLSKVGAMQKRVISRD